MKVKPIGARLLVEETTPEEKTKSGLIITSDSSNKTIRAKVLAVGTAEECQKIKVGSIVMYSRYNGEIFEEDGNDYRIISIEDILATVE
ncbi:MAG: co-chaperone GroES [Bacteroidales bacterium]